MSKDFKENLIVVDTGNKNIKLRTASGRYIFTNAMTVPQTSRMDSDGIESEMLDALDIEIIRNGDEKNSERYLVGQCAINAGAEGRGVGVNKYKSDDIYFMTLASAAIGILKQQLATKKIIHDIETDITLGTMLPLDEYLNKKDKCIEVFQDALVGETTAIFRGKTFNGETVVKFNVTKENIYTMPEGAGAAMAILIDEKTNKIKKDYNALLEKYPNVLCLDLGGNTLDISAVKYDMNTGKIGLIPQMNICKPLGILKSEVNIIREFEILNQLKPNHGLSASYLDHLIRNEHFTYKVDDTVYDFEKIANTELRALAVTEVTEAMNLINSINIRDFKTSYCVVLTGGSNMIIKDAVIKRLKSQNIAVGFSPDPIYDNVNGSWQTIVNKIQYEIDKAKAGHEG